MRRAGPALAALGAGAALCGLVLAAPTANGQVGAAASARLAPTTTLALEMDEPAGATVAADSSGFGHDAAIGSHVRMRGGYATIDRHSPDEGIYYGADHLIMVPDAADSSLDPGAGDFTVEIRYRSTVKFGNVIQKGQAKTSGGQVKFQQPKGVISCMFKSPNGQAAIGSKTPLNDGQWHVVRCERTSTQVTMYVDGVFRNRIRKNTGTIDNNKPWTIGGKLDCDTSNPNTGADSCDYFAGDIDYVHLIKG
ncbi:hypothetical protein KDN32_08530 [Nocardioides sp. J2M5]|uniref:laminin G domain-containing protein n=1 Tax=Nocardioides palaemonis TaxID=2829810 RepID=UPI001BA7B53E|nr:laminin G domain-containing protein [Nocardioides palaemonis]MBS2937788.1 hypothetical protein [Nocardioides palaemonis]